MWPDLFIVALQTSVFVSDGGTHGSLLYCRLAHRSLFNAARAHYHRVTPDRQDSPSKGGAVADGGLQYAWYVGRSWGVRLSSAGCSRACALRGWGFTVRTGCVGGLDCVSCVSDGLCVCSLVTLVVLCVYSTF